MAPWAEAMRSRRWFRWFVPGCIVFAGCFTFPIGSEPFPPDAMKAYLLLSSYGVIAVSLAALCGRAWEAYLRVLGLTALGMLCRYLLEFGEVSNTYNFTPGNIAAYLILIPLGTLAAYWYLRKAAVRSA